MDEITKERLWIECELWPGREVRGQSRRISAKGEQARPGSGLEVDQGR